MYLARLKNVIMLGLMIKRHSSSYTHRTAKGRHLPYGITEICHPTQVNAPRLTPARQARN